MEHKDLLVHLEEPVVLDCRALLVLLVHLDLQAHEDHKDCLVVPEVRDLGELLDLLVHPDSLDHVDPLVFLVFQV